MGGGCWDGHGVAFVVRCRQTRSSLTRQAGIISAVTSCPKELTRAYRSRLREGSGLAIGLFGLAGNYSGQVTGLEDRWNSTARENYAKAKALADQAAGIVR
jgi:hypothetical protein